MRLSIKIILILSIVPLYASPLEDINLLIRTKQISIYGVKRKDSNTSNGMGVFYNTQNIKLKAEGSETAIKTGAMVQTNPFQNPLYLSIGANYIKENIQGNDYQNTIMDQYSGALAIGYSLSNDLYLEAGENICQLNGSQISDDILPNSSTSKETYLQLGKRFETPVGTLDTHVNSSLIYNTLSAKEENYESSVNYYLDDAIKVGYFYSVHQSEISNGYSVDLGYFSSVYTKDITQDSYNITLGLKANFTDITRLSTYTPTRKVKKRLSKSHKFDTIILQKNMTLHR